jgi:hypothetical protein
MVIDREREGVVISRDGGRTRKDIVLQCAWGHFALSRMGRLGSFGIFTSGQVPGPIRPGDNEFVWTPPA